MLAPPTDLQAPRVTVVGPQPVFPDLNKESRVLILVKIAHERVIEFRG